MVSSIVQFYIWPESEAAQLQSRISVLYRHIAAFIEADEVKNRLFPLLEQLASTANLVRKVTNEPLNSPKHPYPQAKYWPLQQSWQEALEIIRLCEGYWLCASTQDPFLIDCARYLQIYASQIESTGSGSRLHRRLAPDSDNPFGESLVRALSMLPDWRAPSPIINRNR
ncbi:hypothetical protein [Rosenbergiella epipactidis]|uniref:hypothetical protein n=1 Tax=Rosenbergiella epipactidis TaxID=1544694 RepID=UPI001F4FCA82|nr:hypothetical protein [Rosenbergiella epipactidis]